MSIGRENQKRGEGTQNAVMNFYKTFARCHVYKIARPGVKAGKRGYRGTMATPGMADLYVTQVEHQLAWFHEAKGGKARLTPEQRKFKDRNEACHVTVVVGDLSSAIAWLLDRGIIRHAADPYSDTGAYTYVRPPEGWVRQ